jgi:hypothetical protein
MARFEPRFLTQDTRLGLHNVSNVSADHHRMIYCIGCMVTKDWQNLKELKLQIFCPQPHFC